MNDFITNVAQMIAESGDEPSYNDILTILRQQQKETNDFTLSPEAYEKLDQKHKEELHALAVATNLDDDEKDLARAATMDVDKILKYYDALNKEVHHFDSDGYIRDDEGVPTILKPLADVMKDRNKLGAFIEKGGKVLGNDGETLQHGIYKLFAMKHIWKYAEQKKIGIDGDGHTYEYYPSKTIRKEMGTLDFMTKKDALVKMDSMMEEIHKKHGLDKSKFIKLTPPKDIRKIDPDAIEMRLNGTVGVGARHLKKTGPKSKKSSGADVDIIKYDRPTYGYIFEFIVYKSSAIVKTTDDEFVKDLASTAKELKI